MTPPWMQAAAVLTVGGIMFASGCGDGSSRQPAGPASADVVKADGDRPKSPVDPTTAKVPKPDLARIGYDSDTRTLVLYDLPDAAKWMLHLPEQPKGVPVNPVHQFMDDVDVDRVAVFYTTAAGHPSPRVTLREVLAARDPNAQK
jgi:hypothetical protein